MSFNNQQNDFNSFLEQFLKKVIKAINTPETPEQIGRNRFMSLQNNPSFVKQRNSFRLDDFLDDIGIILSDELNGGVTKINADTLMIEFSNGDIFRLKLIKDTNFGDGGMGGFYDGLYGGSRGSKGFGNLGGLGDF